MSWLVIIGCAIGPFLGWWVANSLLDLTEWLCSRQERIQDRRVEQP